MEALVDTNVLVYRYDWRFPEKPELESEDFQDGRIYGNVRVVDPFRILKDLVHEPVRA